MPNGDGIHPQPRPSRVVKRSRVEAERDRTDDRARVAIAAPSQQPPRSRSRSPAPRPPNVPPPGWKPHQTLASPPFGTSGRRADEHDDERARTPVKTAPKIVKRPPASGPSAKLHRDRELGKSTYTN